MRRALVLTDDSARHPFRASLPLHVRRPIESDVPPAAGRKWLGLSAEDLRGFALAYCACVVAAVTFLA